jgi:hypothetical protein
MVEPWRLAELSATSEQRLSDDERDLIVEAYARLDTWRHGCAEMHARARESRQIALLQDPKQDPPGARRHVLQLQTLLSTLTNSVADQVDNMPEAVMTPERADLQNVADDMTDTVRFVMSRNDFETLHRRRVSDCFITGTAVTQITWDETMDGGEGNVALIRWPMEAFLWDPAAEDIQDARALIKVSWHPLSWFKARYPERARYVSGEDAEYGGLGVPDAADERAPNDEPRAMLIEYWYREYDAKRRRYKVSVAHLAGGALLASARNVYDHGMYPFVLDVYTPIEGLPVGNSMIQELAPMMRYVNRYAHYIDVNLQMSSKPRILARRNSGIDVKALADWESDIIEGDQIDAEALQWLQPKPFNALALQEMLQFQTDIKQDSGQNQFTRGETAGGVTAATAIAALQEAGGKISRLRTAALNRGYARIVEQVTWLIAQYYDDERVTLVTGKDGRQREVNMSPGWLFGKSSKNALPPAPYSVQVQVNRRNPLRVQAQNELFMQAYAMAAQNGAPFPLHVLFELLQVDGKDRIMPVLRQVDQVQQQMAQLAGQNQQLMAQNEQQSRMIEQYARAVGGEARRAQAPPTGPEGGPAAQGGAVATPEGAPG